MGGDEMKNFRRQVDGTLFSLFLQDRLAGLQIGGLNVYHQSPLKTGFKALLHALQLFRRTIGREDDLFAFLMQGIKSVKKLVLGALLVAEELDIVNHQDIHIPVQTAELRGLVFLDGIDEISGEALAVDIEDANGFILFLGIIADCLNEMSFTQTHTSIDDERVEGGGTRRFGYRQRSRFGELVALTLDIAVKAVTDIQIVRQATGCRWGRFNRGRWY